VAATSKADLDFAYEQTRRLEARGMGLFGLPPKKKAGRPKLYQSQAEKKRAYRERLRGKPLEVKGAQEKRLPEEVTDMEITENRRP
jgi:hypothetical protein